MCNADESEPGTFKDRLLMEEDPFAVVEGMTVAGYATGCERGYLLRGEYPLAAERMTGAIAAARSAGLLGGNVMGAGFAFDIEIRRGAGAYICGEETALFNSIEGKRGEPRNKPPFPVQVGLFGRPTVVNNVETLVNVPALLRRAAPPTAASAPAARPARSSSASPAMSRAPASTRRRSASRCGSSWIWPARGRFARCCSGRGRRVRGTGRPRRGADLRGHAGDRATLGSGVVMAFGESVDLVDIVRRIAEFFRDESCGQCVPCRVGTVRQEELLARLRARRPIGSDAQELALPQGSRAGDA